MPVHHPNAFERDDFKLSVERLKKKGRLFQLVHADMQKMKKSARVSASLKRGDAIRNTVKKTVALFDGLYDASGILIGEDHRDNLSGVGFLPAVAIIISSTAAMSYWLSDAIKIMKTEQAIERLIANGVEPARARDIVDNRTNWGNVVLFLGAIFGIWYFVSSKNKRGDHGV